MKSSIVVTMFIALIISNSAYADKVLVIKMQNGHEMYFSKNMFAAAEGGRTDIYRKGSQCAFIRHEDEHRTAGSCKAMFDEFRRMREEMMKKHGMTEDSMMGNMPKGSSQVRKIGNKVIAKYNTVCYEAGQWGEIVACFSTKVHNLMKTTMDVDPQDWMKDFQMDKMPGRNLTEQALDKLQRNAFLMFRANYLTASGLNPFFVSSMPDTEVKRMVKDAKARGEPPPETKVVSIETKSMNVNCYEAYKNVPLKQFIAGGMGGGSGGDMSTADTPAMTGGDLNLEELIRQGAADTQSIPKKDKGEKKKLTFKERMKLLKDKATKTFKKTEE